MESAELDLGLKDLPAQGTGTSLDQGMVSGTSPSSGHRRESRAMRPTSSSTSRSIRLANFPAAHRSLAPTAGEWHQQTPSYEQTLGSFGAIGAPGQDMRRLATGPALYVNGPPDRGSKATLATMSARSIGGEFGKGLGHMIQMHQPICKKSMVGPDPYDTTIGNLWLQRERMLAFQAEDGRPRSCEWSNFKFHASISHADARRPQWVRRSQSHQHLVPHNRVLNTGAGTQVRWTPEASRGWPEVLPR